MFGPGPFPFSSFTFTTLGTVCKVDSVSAAAGEEEYETRWSAPKPDVYVNVYAGGSGYLVLGWLSAVSSWRQRLLLVLQRRKELHV